MLARKSDANHRNLSITMATATLIRVELDKEDAASAAGARAYDVVVGAGILARAASYIEPLLKRKRVLIVTDAHVAAFHLSPLENNLVAAGIEVKTLILPPGENQKSFEGLAGLCDWMIAQEAERQDLVIAFGGGVIGDLVGLAAGLVKRGMPFVQIPTSLLAQVDSSVGGKTAINVRAGKNLIGLFYQPRLVLADLQVLQTLDPREMRAGYAEIVKYGLLGDAQFFDWCEDFAPAIGGGDLEALHYAVSHSIRMKARIVAADEREHGERALLNLGHSFGHALEALTGFSSMLLHGEAVAIGMSLAFRFSARLGLCPAAAAQRVDQHLRATGFVTDLKSLPGGPFSADDILAAMRQDKKNERGGLHLILVDGIGRARSHKAVDAAELLSFLQDSVTH